MQRFWGSIIPKFKSILTSKEAWCNCLLLLHVVPPLLFTVTSFVVTPTNSLAVPSSSLGVHQYNKCDMRNLHKQNFTIVFASIRCISTDPTFYLELANMPAHQPRCLNFHFEPLAVCYELFPQWNQRQLDFFSIEHKSIYMYVCSSYFLKNSTQVTSSRPSNSQGLTVRAPVWDTTPWSPSFTIVTPS